MENKSKIAVFKTLTVLVASAFMAAISLVCGKYLAIPIGDVMRFSFENTPIILSGVIFGPCVGAAVGVAADLVGCLAVGFTINPIITLGAGMIGFISGGSNYILKKLGISDLKTRIIISAALSHFVGSLIIKTIGLAAFYSIPFYSLFLLRLINYAIVGSLDGLIVYQLLKNKSFIGQINSMLRKNEKRTA